MLNTLMIIAKGLFDVESRLNNFKEMCSLFRTDSPFRRIFSMIFKNQTSNRGFVREVLSRMLHKLQFIYMQALKNEHVERHRDWEAEMIREIFLFGLDSIRKRVDMLGGIDL